MPTMTRGLARMGKASAVAFVLMVVSGVSTAQYTGYGASGDIQQVRQSMAQLLSEIERVKSENARLQGRMEVLQHEINALKGGAASTMGQETKQALSRLQAQLAAVDERTKRFEPIRVELDGLSFTAQADEKREFDAALAQFRSGNYRASSDGLLMFTRRYADSGYRASAFFWLGNALYAQQDCKSAILNFEQVVQFFPDSPKAPDAMLGMANCHAELKDQTSTRVALDTVVRRYPRSEAARLASEKLRKL